MSSLYIYAPTAVLFSIGLLGLIYYPQLLRKIIALNVMAGGVFLFFIAISYQTPGPKPDLVPLVMVLTGIVVTISTTAFALYLIRRIYEKTGKTGFDEVCELDRDE